MVWISGAIRTGDGTLYRRRDRATQRVPIKQNRRTPIARRRLGLGHRSRRPAPAVAAGSKTVDVLSAKSDSADSYSNAPWSLAAISIAPNRVRSHATAGSAGVSSLPDAAIAVDATTAILPDWSSPSLAGCVPTRPKLCCVYLGTSVLLPSWSFSLRLRIGEGFVPIFCLR